ncbi:hypothetical protein RclHR1_05480015 [Rhizophagus clarus]|uniref:Uncharacterized protein n=1 Tax=Rhizophagus clarus TaxID=94130 RepID=A0A2Z6S5S6_9GLOM|nr:hypothetical protein RclHR1_05480015 [Rhizophagus clarus]
MDAAMEQIIGFRGHTLQWNLPDNTNKLCHRCDKLGCAPNQCPSCQKQGRTRGRNLVAVLKERFNINQPARPKERSRSGSRSHLRLKVSFSTVLRTPPSLSTPNQDITMFPHEAANILSLLKSLQHDMAEHLGLLPPPDIPATNQTLDMLIDAPAIPDSTGVLVSSQPTALPVQTPLNPLSPGFIPTRPVSAHLFANSISGFIESITSSSSSSNSAGTADSN